MRSHFYGSERLPCWACYDKKYPRPYDIAEIRNNIQHSNLQKFPRGPTEPPRRQVGTHGLLPKALEWSSWARVYARLRSGKTASYYVRVVRLVIMIYVEFSER